MICFQLFTSKGRCCIGGAVAGPQVFPDLERIRILNSKVLWFLLSLCAFVHVITLRVRVWAGLICRQNLMKAKSALAGPQSA